MVTLSDAQGSPKPLIALIDSDFLVYSIGFASADATEKIAKARLTEWLTDIVYMNLECDDYKAYITGKGNFRYDVAVTVPYKGNRKDAVKPPYYLELREHLRRLGAVETEGEEADDAVGIESNKADYWIVHVDKDLDQLPGWHYNPKKDLQYFVSDDEGLKNFYTQMLVGDRVDNIVGLKGIGPVKAAKILKDAVTEQELYKAVVEAYEAANEPPERVLENARLLWLRRTEGELWQPPVKVNVS